MPGESGETVLDLSELSRRVEAEEYRSLGEQRHAQGDFADAAAYFQISLELFPTPEAHVALAWALAARGSYAEAIEQCRAASALDPEIGNPYNDIGVYLARLSAQVDERAEREQMIEEALGYFERALRAPVYDCRHYPLYHAATIWEQRGAFMRAKALLLQSLEIDPTWEPAQVALRRVLGWLN